MKATKLESECWVFEMFFSCLAAKGLVVKQKKNIKFPEIRIIGLEVLTAHHRMIFEKLIQIGAVFGGQLAASGPRRRWGTPTGGCVQLKFKLLRDRRPVEHDFPAVGPANTCRSGFAVS